MELQLATQQQQLVQSIVHMQLLIGLGYKLNQLQARTFGYLHRQLFQEFMHSLMEQQHHGLHLQV